MTRRNCDTPEDAVTALNALYADETAKLREAFEGFVRGKLRRKSIRGHYPYLQVEIGTAPLTRVTRSYGFCDQPGRYRSTITRPDLFNRYLLEQLVELRENHGCTFEVGLSETPIPIHFAFPQGLHLEQGLTAEQITAFRNLFDSPDLTEMDDDWINGEVDLPAGAVRPLSNFSAPASTTHSIACATTPAPTVPISRTSYCSPIISSTSTASAAWQNTSSLIQAMPTTPSSNLMRAPMCRKCRPTISSVTIWTASP